MNWLCTLNLRAHTMHEKEFWWQNCQTNQNLLWLFCIFISRFHSSLRKINFKLDAGLWKVKMKKKKIKNSKKISNMIDSIKRHIYKSKMKGIKLKVFFFFFFHSCYWWGKIKWAERWHFSIMDEKWGSNGDW